MQPQSKDGPELGVANACSTWYKWVKGTSAIVIRHPHPSDILWLVNWMDQTKELHMLRFGHTNVGH